MYAISHYIRLLRVMAGLGPLFRVMVGPSPAMTRGESPGANFWSYPPGPTLWNDPLKLPRRQRAHRGGALEQAQQDADRLATLGSQVRVPRQQHRGVAMRHVQQR